MLQSACFVSESSATDFYTQFSKRSWPTYRKPVVVDFVLSTIQAIRCSSWIYHLLPWGKASIGHPVPPDYRYGLRRGQRDKSPTRHTPRLVNQKGEQYSGNSMTCRIFNTVEFLVVKFVMGPFSIHRAQGMPFHNKIDLFPIITPANILLFEPCSPLRAFSSFVSYILVVGVYSSILPQILLFSGLSWGKYICVKRLIFEMQPLYNSRFST